MQVTQRLWKIHRPQSLNHGTVSEELTTYRPVPNNLGVKIYPNFRQYVLNFNIIIICLMNNSKTINHTARKLIPLDFPDHCALKYNEKYCPTIKFVPRISELPFKPSLS